MGGTWVPLLESPQGTGLASLGHDKYSTERFFPWLVLDAQVKAPPTRIITRLWPPPPPTGGHV